MASGSLSSTFEMIFCPILVDETEIDVIPTRSAISCQHAVNALLDPSSGSRHCSIPDFTLFDHGNHSPRRSVPKLVKSLSVS